MGSECSINKRCYDISMSKRTRKSFHYSVPVPDANRTTCGEIIPALESFLDGNGGDQSSPSKSRVEDGDQDNDNRKSFKQLIDGDEKAKLIIKSGDQGSRARSSLGQHFTDEENHLQLVKKQQKAVSLQGVKLKKLVSRCAKVFRHLVKAESDPALREPRQAVLRLTM